MISQSRRLSHEERRIRADAISVQAPKQPAHRLTCHFAKNVPERDINAADRVRNTAASTQPEGICTQCFADTLRFEWILTQVQRLESLQSSPPQPIVCERRAPTRYALIRIHRDERVDT